jgi:hypothetical protein
MLRLTPQAPFLKPSLVDTYAVREFVKLQIEPNPTLRLINQVIVRATP